MPGKRCTQKWDMRRKAYEFYGTGKGKPTLARGTSPVEHNKKDYKDFCSSVISFPIC